MHSVLNYLNDLWVPIDIEHGVWKTWDPTHFTVNCAYKVLNPPAAEVKPDWGNNNSSDEKDEEPRKDVDMPDVSIDEEEDGGSLTGAT